VITYLDHAATTPLRPEVVQAMAEVHAGPLGNPTGSHRPAQRAKRLLEEARDEVADLMGRSPGEIVFTSGGTESANLAIFGTLQGEYGDVLSVRPTVVCSAVEHPAVLESCRAAGTRVLADVVSLGVDAAGVVDLSALAEMVDARTRVVAVMLANNETGAVQPLAAVIDTVRDRAEWALVFTDAVQAAAFMDLARATKDADLVGLSAHKVGGPVGVGVLAIGPRVDLVPHHYGGGQERERRSGTQDVAGAVGLATALRVAAAEREHSVEVTTRRRDRLCDGLLSAIDGAIRTVPPDVATLPGHLHLCLRGVEREELMVALGDQGVCASGGSSCASGALQSSHVLAAMGVPDDLARGAVRFTLGEGTTDADVERALHVVPAVVASLRRGA
jgi:cysteine desulfurase